MLEAGERKLWPGSIRWGDRKLTKRRLTQIEVREFRRATLETARNLSEVLLISGGSGLLEANIPECMVQVGGQINPVLFYSETGIVKVYKGSHAFNKFFEIVDLRLSTHPPKEHEALVLAPQYLLLSLEKSTQVCMTKEECISSWKSSNPYLARRFVRSDQQKPVVYRVNYQRDANTYTVFAIKNAGEPGHHHARPISLNIIDSAAAHRSSIYQHDIFSYIYAGKLLKTSFSPYHPYPSLLHDRVSKSRSPPHTTLQTPKGSREGLRGKTAVKGARGKFDVKNMMERGRNLQFVVETGNLDACKVYQITERIAQLEHEVFRFVTSLQKTMRGKVIKELGLDFIRTTESGYILIDLISLVLEPLTVKESPASTIRQAFQKVTSPRRTSPVLLSSIIYPPMASPERPLTRTRSPTAVLMGAQRYSAISNHHSPHTSDIVDLDQFAISELLTVQSKYDLLMGRVRKAKDEQRDIIEEIDAIYGRRNLTEMLVERFFHTFVTSEEVNTLYVNKMKQDFEVMKAGILSILRGQASFTSRLHMKKAHQDVDHLSSLSQVFYKVISKEATSIGLSPEHTAMIIQRLSAFLNDVVPDKRPS